MTNFDVIKRPIVTEKSTIQSEAGIYSFEVDTRAKKPQIKHALENAFKIKIVDVRTVVCRDRARRKGQTLSHVRYWKKAVVQLAPGQKISIFEGA